MAWGAILGGLLGAGGQVAAGSMGSATGGQGRTVNYNPALDYALQASQFDGLNYTGFGDIGMVPSPLQRFIGSLHSTPITDKTRADVIKALTVIGNHPDLLDDPTGQQFSKDQLQGFLQNPDTIPDGRRLPKSWTGSSLGIKRSGKMATKSLSRETNPLPVTGIMALKKILRERGMGVQDIAGLLEQESQWKADVQKLKDAGLDRLQTGTILNRAEAAKAASTLLGDAGRFATGGDPSEFQSGLMNRLQQNISDQEQALLLRAQFGGFNPASGLEGIQRMREDADMTALTQAVQMAGALTSGLSGGSQMTQSAAGISSQNSLGALGIAANQAAAANALRQNAAQASGESWANGIAGASNAISQQVLLSQLMSQKPATTAPQFSFYNTASQYGAPGTPGSVGGTPMFRFGS